MQKRDLGLAFLILTVIGTLVAVEFIIRGEAPGPCTVPRPASLSATAVPSEAEMSRLLADARERLTPSLGSSTDSRRFTQRMRELEQSLPVSPDRSCRALRAARDAFRELPDDSTSAMQRNALVLVLDLTAAFIARQSH